RQGTTRHRHGRPSRPSRARKRGICAMSRRQVEVHFGSLAKHARRVSRPLAPLALTLFFLASCSSRDSFDESSGPDFNPGDCSRNACSEDGRSVLGCQGEVVKTCEVDSLCSSGECVRGCEAADKAQSTVGCEFYVAKPSARHLFANYDTSCYA